MSTGSVNCKTLHGTAIYADQLGWFWGSMKAYMAYMECLGFAYSQGGQCNVGAHSPDLQQKLDFSAWLGLILRERFLFAWTGLQVP